MLRWGGSDESCLIMKGVGKQNGRAHEGTSSAVGHWHKDALRM